MLSSEPIGSEEGSRSILSSLRRSYQSNHQILIFFLKYPFQDGKVATEASLDQEIESLCKLFLVLIA